MSIYTQLQIRSSPAYPHTKSYFSWSKQVLDFAFFGPQSERKLQKKIVVFVNKV